MAAITSDRRQRKFEAVRRRLLDAGRDTIAEVGQGDLTIQLVTDRADVAQATFYSHFSSKQEFVDAVRDLALTTLSERIEALDGPPHHGLAQLTAILMRAIETDPNGVRFALVVSREMPGTSPIEALQRRCISDGVRTGVFTNVADVELALALYGGAVRAALQAALMAGGIDEAASTEVMRHGFALLGTPEMLVEDAITAVRS